jgi:hypothetical protein
LELKTFPISRECRFKSCLITSSQKGERNK